MSSLNRDFVPDLNASQPKDLKPLKPNLNPRIKIQKRATEVRVADKDQFTLSSRNDTTMLHTPFKEIGYGKTSYKGLGRVQHQDS